MQLAPSNTVINRYLAEESGAWFEVEPCPNQKGVAFIHDMVEQGNPQKMRAAQLAADLKEPLRGDLLVMLKQHRLTDAAKKYQEATGLDDLSVPAMVVNILDPDHPLSKP